jgi:hypothetical protein
MVTGKGRFFVMRRDQYRDSHGTVEGPAGVRHDDTGRQRCRLRIRRATRPGGDPALQQGDPRRQQKCEGDGGENVAQGWGVGVVEDIPDAQDQPFAGRFVKVRTSRRNRNPQQRRGAPGSECYDNADRAMKFFPCPFAEC